MKRILFLLLLTVSIYGQNPSRFAKIQITGNSNSGTATKVNVQEANGEVNTQTINTGFNKNFGLNSGDVVGANTLLNQYSTTPVDWTATAFNSGQVVFYGGKQWIAKIATVAGDVPSVSSKWEEITFEALANKTVIVDATPTDGSNNAVSSNAVFDGLALKSNIGHTHVASQITDLSKASVGLGNVDNTSDLSKPLSTATINALATKFPTPTGLTTNYLPKWNGSGFGNSQIFDNGGNVGIGTTTPLPYTKLNVEGHIISSLIDSYPIIGVLNQGTEGFPLLQLRNVKNGVDKGWNIENGRTVLGDLGFYNEGGQRVTFKDNGRVLINKTNDDLTNQLQVAGTISASPATTANQVPTWGQVQAVVSSGTYTPSNQTNAAQTVNFMRSYWERKGNVLTVTTSLTYTVTQIQSTASFLITLPNGFLVSGANGRIIGSSLLHTTQVIFNNNANMKAYEASDSSQINLQANFQATVSSGTYETTIIYTVLIQ